jgi:hypothetical protein
MKNSDLDVPELPHHGKEASSSPSCLSDEAKHIGLLFFDSSNNIINLAKSYSVDSDA